jgi:hypothetical protein
MEGEDWGATSAGLPCPVHCMSELRFAVHAWCNSPGLVVAAVFSLAAQLA